MTHESSRRGPRAQRGEIWVRKFTSFEEENRADLEYWQEFTPDERVEIVERLRQEWWQRHGDGVPRMEKVVRVLSQT